MKEIPLNRVLHGVTLKRLLNATVAMSSFLLSALLKKRIVWGRPFILTVEPTNLCNLRCPLCVTGNGKLTRKGGQMDFDLFRRIIDDVGDCIFYLLLYHQGEPFINKAFLDFVRYAKRRKICVSTSTNAHFLDEETARQTVASGLDALIVSVDGADQATYETYRVGGRLNDVLQGIANLVHEKAQQQSKTPYLYVQFIAMQHNEHQIDEMKQLCRQWPVDRLLVKTVQVENVAQARRWLPRASSLQRYRVGGAALRPKRLVKGPCHRPWTSSLVNCDGTVVPCCFDKNGTHALGRIGNSATLEKIWNTAAYDSFRTKILRERGTLDICANCSQGLRLYL